MNIINKNYKTILIVTILISFLLHYHVFSLDLVGIHVWRQTETQTVINNFYREDFNIFHPKIYDRADTNRIVKMEFPIMQWVFALFFRAFGNHIAISRILTFIIGLFSVYGMFYLCKNIFNNTVLAVIAAWTFNFSPEFYYYTINPLPDNFALCCGIWSVVFFFKYKNNCQNKYIVLSSSLLTLATLAKLPFILFGSVVFSSFVLNIFSEKGKPITSLKIVVIYFIALLPAVIWYIEVIPTWGDSGIVKGILDNKTSINHLLDIFKYHLVSTLPELLINYGSVAFFVAGFYFLIKRKIYKNRSFYIFVIWGMSILLYYFFEINMIDKVHDYYLFPFLPLIFLLVAYGGYHLVNSKNKFLRYFSLVALMVLPFTAYLRADSRWDTKDPGFNPIYFKYKNELRQLTPEGSRCIIGNDDSHYILLYYIDRIGWAYDAHKLDKEQLAYYINNGAKYLFVDDNIDTASFIKSHLKKKIFEKGNVRVYLLK